MTKPCDRWCPFASCDACIWAGGTDDTPTDDDTEGEAT